MVNQLLHWFLHLFKLGLGEQLHPHQVCGPLPMFTKTKVVCKLKSEGELNDTEWVNHSQCHHQVFLRFWFYERTLHFHVYESHFRQRSSDQFEANWTLNCTLLNIKKTFLKKVQWVSLKAWGPISKIVWLTCERIKLTFGLFCFFSCFVSWIFSSFFNYYSYYTEWMIICTKY
jgi:hypothetical protein